MLRLKKRVLTTGIATLALLALPTASAQALKVVSTFSIISDFARNVGGDRIELTTLVGPDGDAHSYEPRPTDATAIKDADVVLVNGIGFEGFLDRLIQASGGTATVVQASEGAELLRNNAGHSHHEEHNHPKDHAHHDDHGHHHDHDHDHENEHRHEDKDTSAHHHHGEYDPHAWQSVDNAQVYVNNIANAFCAADQQGCPVYKANARSYNERLKALQKDLEAKVAQIPPDQRTIITSHDAFAYLGRAYGLQFSSPQGASTGSEASAGDMAALIRQIRDEKAAAIFLENISNPRLIQQIAGETGMSIGGKLYSDALSGESGPASTYIDMMRHNIDAISDAARQK
ncbi:MAG TPA: ABC transporter substrate-binding protein [Pusillimonas sp.]|jgi:zinc/manganese transport system substrate-binding protein|nr:ABC transporter substrate-binding protein [Pusillimonas sp.]|tara:strand:- start:97949 stop:98980 length:1032 start_codon:yes stop_codon:yes gene_type:complete